MMDIGVCPRAAPPLSRDEEQELLVGLRGREPDSFERMVRIWCGKMLAVARKLVGNEEDARDCVQEAFLKAFQNINGFEGRSSLGTWLVRIVMNCALMRLRSRGYVTMEHIEALLPEFDSTGHRLGRQYQFQSSVEELASREEVRKLVRSSIDRLPAAYRLALVLRDIEGYDTAEAAQMLEIKEVTLKVRLHRARTALRKILEPLMKGGVI
jgi:RNA polymerase sigma-70 factor (ECF subfamily)